MKLSPKTQHVYDKINPSTTKLGDLRSLAKEIKKDHQLAIELWNIGEFLPRQLAILLMDKQLLSQEVINQLDIAIQKHPIAEQEQLIDWLMANQLAKDKRTIKLIHSWKDSSSALQRRVFWYYQARLRWVGQAPPPDTDDLLTLIEERIEDEKPEVQWAMNFAAAQMGVFQEEYRQRCIALGERTSLYKDEIVPKGCTPSYLPEFIAIQVAKQKK